MSIRDQSWVPLSPALPFAATPAELLKNCRLKENRSSGALLHLTQRLVSIVSPGNHLAERKYSRRVKRLLKETEHREIRSSEGAFTPP